MTLKVSTGLRNEILATSSLRDLVNGSVLRLYAGTVPDTADASIGSATLLCEVSVGGNGTGVTLEPTATAGVIRKTSTESWFGSVLTSGTATFMRVETTTDDGSLSTSLPRIQGVVASAGGDVYIPNPSLIQGNSQAIDYFAIALPASL